MKNAVIVFAKYPKPGSVKTRLAKEVGRKRACRIYEELLKDTITNISEEKSTYDIIVSFNPHDKNEYFLTTFPSVQLFPQVEGNLGEKLVLCVTHFLKNNEKVIVIGSDLPAMNSELIKNAISVLDEKEIVLGPAVDGGYYLIGMKAVHDIFSSVPWSTEAVLEKTFEKINELKLSYGLLSTQVDVDSLGDLRNLKKIVQRNCPKTLKQAEDLF